MLRLWLLGMLAIALASDGARAAPLQDAARTGDLARMRAALDAGADLDQIAGLGAALHWVVIAGDDAAVELLLTRGAEVNRTTVALGAALHSAAAGAPAAMVARLLRAGADPNAPRRDGYTPLHLAVERGEVAIVRLLLDHGADPNALAEVPCANSTLAATPPLHLAIVGGHAEIALMLRDAGAAPPPIEPASLLVTGASAERGRGLMVTLGCASCHTSELGDRRQLDGPPLYGVVGRPPASQLGYHFSPSLQALGGRWTEEQLLAFITHPRVAAPGTTMDVEAGGDARDRADIVAFLRTLSGPGE